MDFLAVFAPISLAKERPKPVAASGPVVSVPYLVAVPYSDPSIPKQVGAGRWAGRVLCEVAEVAGNSPIDARDRARKVLEGLGRLSPVFGQPNGASRVSVLTDRIVVERR